MPEETGGRREPPAKLIERLRAADALASAVLDGEPPAILDRLAKAYLLAAVADEKEQQQ